MYIERKKYNRMINNSLIVNEINKEFNIENEKLNSLRVKLKNSEPEDIENLEILIKAQEQHIEYLLNREINYSKNKLEDINNYMVGIAKRINHIE